jgi:integrase
MKNFRSKLAPVIKEYLELRHSLGYSGKQENYLLLFDTYCHENHPDLETLTREAVRGWIENETTKGKPITYEKAGAVRLLARYMGDGAYILPTTTVSKRPKSTPYIFTDEELTKLFEKIDKLSETSDISTPILFPTLFRLLYTCGLRPYEGRLLERRNINFETGEILITKTKRHKERVVVMSDDMLEQFKKYDIARAIINPASDYFFITFDGVNLTNAQLYSFFKLCWKKANSNVSENMLPKVRTYDLRHRFASTILQKWLNEGRDLYAMLPYLRAYMGHDNFSSTAYYIHILPENLLRSPNVDWKRIDEVDPGVEIWKN